MSVDNKSNLQDEIMLGKIREILLKEDRAAIHNLQDVLEDPEKLSNRVSPIVEHHLDLLKQKFPKEFEVQVNKLIENKLKDSQDDLLNVIYPVVGKMIRKYVNHQFQQLKEGIDNQVRNTFSAKGFLGRIKATIFGVSDSDMVLSNFGGTVLEEIYVIQRDSGLLIGSYSRNNTIDRDVVAGMLTAIKSFVEDAFQREREELELIQYGNYKILVQNFHSYYISVALSGTLSASEKDRLSSQVLDFAEKNLGKRIKEINEEINLEISFELKEYFQGGKAS